MRPRKTFVSKLDLSHFNVVTIVVLNCVFTNPKTVETTVATFPGINPLVSNTGADARVTRLCQKSVATVVLNCEQPQFTGVDGDLRFAFEDKRCYIFVF